MIIDAHAHVYAFPKLKDSPGATTFLSAEDQIAIMDRKGVDKAVILPLNNAEAPAEKQSLGEVLYICEKYPGRFIPFYNIDPRLPRKPDMIRAEEFEFILNQCKELGCKGIGEFTARLYWDEPCMLKLCEACEKVGFPITFHTVSRHGNSYGVLDEIGLPGLEGALKRFPKLKFFGHSQGFWSEIGGDLRIEEKNGYPKGPVKPGGRLKILMRQYPNLYGDLSAGSGFNALACDPAHAYEFIEEFQDRLLFGFDFCSVKGDFKHIDWLKAARDEKHISSEAYEKIMWKNINTALGLGL